MCKPGKWSASSTPLSLNQSCVHPSKIICASLPILQNLQSSRTRKLARKSLQISHTLGMTKGELLTVLILIHHNFIPICEARCFHYYTHLHLIYCCLSFYVICILCIVCKLYTHCLYIVCVARVPLTARTKFFVCVCEHTWPIYLILICLHRQHGCKIICIKVRICKERSLFFFFTPQSV